MLAWLLTPSAEGPPIMVHGDSTAIASRIPLSEKWRNLWPAADGSRWWNIVAASYTPRRAVINDGVKGQDLAAALAKLQRRADPPGSTVIVYDRINDGETLEAYERELLAIAVLERKNRLLVLPQVPDAPATTCGTANVLYRRLNDFLAQRLSGSTFDPGTRDAFLRALADPATRADGLHRNGRGQAIEALYIRRWLRARSW